MKLESSDPRHILKEVRRNISGNYRLSLRGVNPVKKGNYLQGGGLVFNDVLWETHLTSSAEFKFEAVEVGAVKDITETVESGTASLESNKVLSTEFDFTASKETQTDTHGGKCKEHKEMEEQIKILQEKIIALTIEVHKREFCIKRFQNDIMSEHLFLYWIS